jgi:hypothetical protein
MFIQCLQATYLSNPCTFLHNSKFGMVENILNYNLTCLVCAQKNLSSSLHAGAHCMELSQITIFSLKQEENCQHIHRVCLTHAPNKEKDKENRMCQTHMPGTCAGFHRGVTVSLSQISIKHSRSTPPSQLTCKRPMRWFSVHALRRHWVCCPQYSELGVRVLRVDAIHPLHPRKQQACPIMCLDHREITYAREDEIHLVHFFQV